ncbi:hypothetical protein CDAR_56041 [Caerostris darwini]|uniref:Uncharacterized protein n=1 Tax=Caerostris darwini TaxID=1538125 RepID=A0AAV4RQT5_9ARAC|nr:hypothetical protein CDAR_56041 [Caerostris darwini]
MVRKNENARKKEFADGETKMTTLFLLGMQRYPPLGPFFTDAIKIPTKGSISNSESPYFDTAVTEPSAEFNRFQYDFDCSNQ